MHGKKESKHLQQFSKDIRFVCVNTCNQITKRIKRENVQKPQGIESSDLGAGKVMAFFVVTSSTDWSHNWQVSNLISPASVCSI